MSHLDLHPERMRAFSRQFRQDIAEVGVTDEAAQLAYYLLFAAFPFLTCVVTLGAYLPVGRAAEHLMHRLQGVVPPAAMKILRDQLESLLEQQRPKLLTLGLVLALYTASRGTDAFRKALNRAHRVRESRSTWRTQLLAVGVTIAAALFGLLGMTMVAAGGRAGLWVADRIGVDRYYQVLWSWWRWPSTALLIFWVAVLAYWRLPNVKQRFRQVAPGAVLATVSWLVATWGFTEYVDHFGNYDVAYGSLGGAIVLLTWLYLSALVFLLGGQVNAALQPPQRVPPHPTAAVDGPPPSNLPPPRWPGTEPDARH